MRDHLLTSPDTNLTSLDLCLYSSRIVAFHLVDNYGHDGMLDAFADVLPLSPLNRAPASALDEVHVPPPDEPPVSPPNEAPVPPLDEVLNPAP